MTSRNEVVLERPVDPLLALIPLSYSGEFYPYGFPAKVVSNSPLVLEAAQESWGGYRKRFGPGAMEVRCLVGEGTDGRVPPPPVVRAQGNLLISVADRDNFACCDLLKGFASAWVTRAVVEAREYFLYHVLEAMMYTLLDQLFVVAVHAACVTRNGHGVLLAGDSGAGKSSLAYACARRGWVYSSDDSSMIVRRERGRTVLGNPRLFRFRRTAGELFPEFRGMKESHRGNGKPTIEVRTEALPAIRTALESRVDYVVFLNRRDVCNGHAQIYPVSKEEAMGRLFFDPWPADLPARQERRAAVERLASAPACELRYRELDQAVDILEQLVVGGLS